MATGAAPAVELVQGAFYLDRVPRTKHVAGPFFSEGSYTKNTPAEARPKTPLTPTAATPLTPSASHVARRCELASTAGSRPPSPPRLTLSDRIVLCRWTR